MKAVLHDMPLGILASPVDSELAGLGVPFCVGACGVRFTPAQAADRVYQRHATSPPTKRIRASCGIATSARRARASSSSSC
eukprot:1094728-Pyramimonas_sp.AAC.1